MKASTGISITDPNFKQGDDHKPEEIFPEGFVLMVDDTDIILIDEKFEFLLLEENDG